VPAAHPRVARHSVAMPRRARGVLGHRHGEPREQVRDGLGLHLLESLARRVEQERAGGLAWHMKAMDREQLRLEPRCQSHEAESPQNGCRTDLHRLDLERVAGNAQNDVADADHPPAVEIDDLPVEKGLTQPDRAVDVTVCSRPDDIGRPGRQRGIAPLRPHRDDAPRLIRLDDTEVGHPLTLAIDSHGRAEERAGEERWGHVCPRLPRGLQAFESDRTIVAKWHSRRVSFGRGGLVIGCRTAIAPVVRRTARGSRALKWHSRRRRAIRRSQAAGAGFGSGSAIEIRVTRPVSLPSADGQVALAASAIWPTRDADFPDEVINKSNCGDRSRAPKLRAGPAAPSAVARSWSRKRFLGVGEASAVGQVALAASAIWARDMLPLVRPQPFPPLAVLAEVLGVQPLPEVEGAAIEAAVLVCLHDDAVLLARRALHPLDPWSGHVGLPGGRWEEGDESLLATALREAEEEIGIDPLAHGRLLGALGTHLGRGRRISGVRIAVFVAALDERPSLELSAELDAVYWVPLSELVPVQVRVAELPDTDVPAYAVELSGSDRLVVWGITYAILERLRALPIL
jgi:8-oxo-dGTP pyrophosphatase MutT (NUDIX family)